MKHTLSRTYEYGIRRVVHVVDGDTFDLEVDLGFYQYGVYRFRLLGVDTPEIYGPNASEAGQEAKRFVASWLEENLADLRINTKKTGSFGRWIAVVWNSRTGESLGDALLAEGLAEEYDR